MTRRDYILLAKAIREFVDAVRRHARTERYLEQALDDAQLMAMSIANYLESDNPRFNRNQFYDACGLSETHR